MIDLKNRWKSATDQAAWNARGATFVAKVQATKAVWFPPGPTDTGKKTVAAAKKTTKGAARKTSGAAKKTTGTARKKSVAAKSNGGAKKVSASARQKKG